MPLDNEWAGVSGRDRERQARYRLARIEHDAVKAGCGGIESAPAGLHRRFDARPPTKEDRRLLFRRGGGERLHPLPSPGGRGEVGVNLHAGGERVGVREPSRRKTLRFPHPIPSPGGRGVIMRTGSERWSCAGGGPSLVLMVLPFWFRTTRAHR